MLPTTVKTSTIDVTSAMYLFSPQTSLPASIDPASSQSLSIWRGYQQYLAGKGRDFDSLARELEDRLLR
ncbi:hypothetical protein IJJ08_00940 [bacterium]|nr:hypothetical protein [bacterium]